MLDNVPFDKNISFDEQVARVRAYVRSEVEKALRESARPEAIAVPCGVCGSPVDFTAGYAAQVIAGSRSAPRCFECTRPARDTEAEAAALAWVTQLGEQAVELGRTVAALR